MRFSYYFYYSRWSQFPQLQQHQASLRRQFSSYSGSFRFIDGDVAGAGVVAGEAGGVIIRKEGKSYGLFLGKNPLLSLYRKSSSSSRNYSSSSVCASHRNPLKQSKPVFLAGVVPVLTFPLRSIHLHTTSLMSAVNLKTNYPSSRYYGGNSKHLGPGTECPPLQDGKARIYNMRFCPYAQRAVLVAEAKGLPYDVVNINLKTKPEWIFPKNPMGKVPTLELESGVALYESLIVSDYLDEVYPGRKLNSSDPLRRAQDRILIENFSPVISSFYRLVFAKGNAEELGTHLQGIKNGLAPFERELAQRGTTFFGRTHQQSTAIPIELPASSADAPGMVDYMIWPWVERLSIFKLVYPDLSDYENDKKENPRLEQWRQAMKEDPAVKAYYLTPEQHFRFRQSYLEGDMPDYDCLEE